MPKHFRAAAAAWRRKHCIGPNVSARQRAIRAKYDAALREKREREKNESTILTYPRGKFPFACGFLGATSVEPFRPIRSPPR